MAEAATFEALLSTLRGFQESRCLLTAVELDVFGAAQDWATDTEVAASAGLDPRAAGMLLNALVAMGALEKQQGRFRCTPASRALAEARWGLLHTVNRWHSWSTLSACVRAGTAQGPEPLARDPGWTESFINAMDARARPLAAGVAAQVGLAGVARMLDIGGASGTFAIAFAQAEPGLHAEILDLPAVLPMALKRIQEAGLQDRVTVRPGDLCRDDLGQGYDLILLSAICHMLDEAENRELFRRVARALAPGGRVVLRDFLLEPDRAGPREAALFALNMLVATRAGSVYTEGDYRAWMTTAGLGDISRPDQEDLLWARKPGP